MPACPIRPASRTLLQKVLREKRTFFEIPAALANPSGSLSGIDSIVASPILDREENVIGALYGERLLGLARPRSPAAPITRLIRCG